MTGTTTNRWLALPIALSLWAGTAFAQVNIDAYRDYFLVGQFGEVCTMCEVTVLCETGTELPPEDKVPDTGSFTLYHLQTRTFWSQVSTIWDWFISNFQQEGLAARGHTPPCARLHGRKRRLATDGNHRRPAGPRPRRDRVRGIHNRPHQSGVAPSRYRCNRRILLTPAPLGCSRGHRGGNVGR